MKYIHQFRVRFSDTDAYGIVHHSKFYNYFEEARIHFSADYLGFSEDMANNSGIKFPVIESSCTYRNPLKFSLEYYVVEVEFENPKNPKLEFNFVITDKNRHKKYAYGKTVHVVVDASNKLCINLPKWLDDKIQLLN